MDIKFPLDKPPACLACGQPCTRGKVSSNVNGNAGRWHYYCLNRTHGRKFACWDDDRGISSTNPRCDCGLPGRDFKAHGEDYYGCSVGTCGWTLSASCFWSDCSAIDDAFGAPIVIELGAEPARNRGPPPVRIDLPTDVEWKVTAAEANSGSPLCSICRMALDKLRKGGDALTTTVSPEVRSQAGCHLCALFVHCVQNRRCAIPGQLSGHVWEYGFDEVDLGQATLYLLRKDPGQGDYASRICQDSEIGCLPSKGTNTGMGVSMRGVGGRELFAGPLERIMGHARQWIEQCETKHPSCQNKTTASFIPTRLIDVGEKKIFQSLTKPVLRRREDIPTGSSYLTLSHCWGGTVPLRLMLNNMVDMMSQIPFTQLPKTFQDAIVVTQNLGLRYIWIDSLCIIQDDEDDWRHEAALMADVYKHGTCNLSASSAPNGLAGLFLDHEPILTKPVRAPFQTDRNNGIVPHDFWPEGVLSFFETGPLLSRGWVVQERLLSRRNIHFSKDQVVWECRCSSACEMFPASAPFKETPLFLKHRFSRVVWGGEEGLQSLRDVWSILVSEYTRCKLTKASDKLIAFGGIASTFTGPLGRRYVAGLWLDNVVYQLCWEGRRGKSQDYIAPSWSWASTEGPVERAFLPVHSPDLVRPMEILDVQVDLIDQNRYGQLKGGYLRAAGRLTTVKIIFENSFKGSSNDAQKKPVLLLPDATGAYNLTRDHVSISWTEMDISDAQERGVLLHLLAVMEHVDPEREHREALRGKPQLDPRRAPCTRWLVLCPVEGHDGKFTRCGTVTENGRSYAAFATACRLYDQMSGRLPVHSNAGRAGVRYDVTII